MPPDEGASTLAAVQDEFIRLGSQLSAVFGFSEGIGRIAGLFFATPASLTQQAVADRLSLTKGTVSLYVRLLEDRRLIVRSHAAKGTRGKSFELNPNLWEDLRAGFQQSLQRRVSLVAGVVQSTHSALISNQSNPWGRILRDRLTQLDSLNSQTGHLLQDLFDESGLSARNKSPKCLQKVPIQNCPEQDGS